MLFTITLALAIAIVELVLKGRSKMLFTITPKKAPIVVPEQSAPEDYAAVCQRIGIRPAHVSTALPSLLHRLNVAVYDTAKVERYMDKKGYWSWFPLRISDLQYRASAGAVARITKTSYSSLYGNTERICYDTSRNPIPYPVLLTIESLAETPDVSVAFFIAALNAHPDPFLGVMDKRDNQRGRIYVIERWDEPSFRG